MGDGMSDGGEIRSVLALGREPFIAGFALAGLPTLEAADADAAAARLRDLRERGDVGVVLIQQALYGALPEEAMRELAREALPVLVPYPEPSWARPVSPEERVIELLRRAIGYRVRLT